MTETGRPKRPPGPIWEAPRRGPAHTTDIAGINPETRPNDRYDSAGIPKVRRRPSNAIVDI
jgi:hypothetical protein